MSIYGFVLPPRISLEELVRTSAAPPGGVKRKAVVEPEKHINKGASHSEAPEAVLLSDANAMWTRHVVVRTHCAERRARLFACIARCDVRLSTAAVVGVSVRLPVVPATPHVLRKGKGGLNIEGK